MGHRRNVSRSPFLLKKMISVSDFRTYAGIPTNVIDSQLNQFVNGAIEYFKSECRREFASTSYVDVMLGSGSQELFLKNYPITELTKVEINESVGWEEVNLDFLEYYQNKIYFTNGLIFPINKKVKVTYTAGYTSYPADLVNACLERAKWMYDMSGVEGAKNLNGIQSKSEGGIINSTTTYREPNHSNIISKYKRWLT